MDIIKKMRNDGYPLKIKGNDGIEATLCNIQPLSGKDYMAIYRYPGGECCHSLEEIRAHFEDVSIDNELCGKDEVKLNNPNTLPLKTQWGSIEYVQLEINHYVNNGCMYIGLVTWEDGFPEPYGCVTVNLNEKAPDYCGYVDTNNMPELENFIKEHELGTFTGLIKQSGFCKYPLYMFDVERLRELCPDGIAVYEQSLKKQ